MAWRLLRRDDIPQAMDLVCAAGWNQTPGDWENVIALEPEGCFAVECDGRVVSTATVTTFGPDLAWIGMVLTDPAYRGRGLARTLMQAALDFVAARGIAWVKLDATDMGRPLYASLGFEDEQPVERRRRSAAGSFETARVDTYTPLPGLDRNVFGADRARVLERLSRFESAGVAGAGFAMARPGRMGAYFGPCVTESAAVAGRLLSWFLARHSAEAAFWDLAPSNAAAVALATANGFEPVRRLIRMARPMRSGVGPLARDDSRVFALAGFEYG